VIILDFENSFIGVDTKNRVFVYKDIVRLVADIAYSSFFDYENVPELLSTIEHHEKINTPFDSAFPNIFEKIDKLIIKNKTQPSLVYRSDIF
jgi:hypothetical protein